VKKNILNRKVVIIPIEIKVRELIHKIYLAYSILKNTNFSIILGGQRFINNNYSFENCIYLDKNTNPVTREKFPIHKQNSIIILDEEGPVSFFHPTMFKERYYFKTLNHQVKNYFFFGKKDLKQFKLKQARDKSVIVGNPKFDLLKKNYNKVFLKESKQISKNHKKYVFITGQAAIKSDNHNKIEGISRYILKENKRNLDKHIKIRKKNYSKKIKNYLALLKLTKKLAIKNPKINFIFRRHPLEEDSFINEYFKNKPQNLKLIYKYSVTPWIMNCDVHIHSGCLTAIESAILKKKQITFMANYDKSFSNFSRFKPFFKNEEDCLKYFENNNHLEKKKILYNLKDLIVNFDDKTFSADLISKFLKKNFSQMQYSRIILKKEKDQLFFKIRKFIEKLASSLKSKLNKISLIYNIFALFSPKSLIITKELKEKKFKYLKKSEILRYFKFFDKKFKILNKISLKKIDQSVFLITKI